MLIAALLACAVGIPETDSTVTSKPTYPVEWSSGCITSEQIEKLSRMSFMVIECLEGTSFCIEWGTPDSATLVASGVPVVPDDGGSAVAGSHVDVTVAVMDTGADPSPPQVTRWSAVLGDGKLPMAIEWSILDVGLCANYQLGTRPELLKGLPIGAAHQGHGGFTLILAVTRSGDRIEAGVDGRFKKVRSALALLDSKPAESAALFDSVARRSELSDALRSFHARALGRAGRCQDELKVARILVSHGLGDSAYVLGCSEGYCLYFSNDFEALADWAFARAAGSSISGDCVALLWNSAIEDVVSNRSSIDPQRAESFIESQRSRLNGFPDDPRFEKCRATLLTWDDVPVGSKSR